MKIQKIIYMSVLVFFTLTTMACQHKGLRLPDSVEAKKTICASETRRVLQQELFSAPANGAVKVAFFDADSTLRISKSGSVSANSTTDVRLLPNVGRALASLQKSGYLIYIVSNQNGVGSGVISCEIAEGALRYTIDEIFKVGGVVHGYDFAENADEYRKPGIGMAETLEAKLKQQYGSQFFIDKKQSFMVGDSAFKKENISATKPAEGDLRWDAEKFQITPGTHFSNGDRLFAQAVGVHFIEATDFFGWRKYKVDVIESVPQLETFLKICKDCTP